MQKFRVSLRTALFIMLLVGAALATFRCQIIVFADHWFGTELAPKLAIVDTDSDLADALKTENCILLVSHAWSMQDALIRTELSNGCRQKLGRFKVFLITPTDPSADNGESDAMYARLDKLCNTNGSLPRFHWFHNSAGFVFLKSGDNIEWKNHVGTYEALKTLAETQPPSDG